MNRITKTDIVVVLILLVILAMAINTERNNRKLYKNSRYTIGTTVRRTYNRFGQSFLDYKYSVEGKEYICTQEYEQTKIKKGENYYVIFQSNKPKISKLLIDKGIISAIDSIPYNGWTELPR
ncbi:hypothetical protein [Carboxylicivirga linearis]|uniref:DUF3592 domain-containing protein n=1 Tax=Carboxylicivirga linearis TaxID=1628157 RepID=A0ABS5JYY0_9BACT|nr:hypothetical protein [Carboxylicivirga linearis]MBS2100120.1 hypothetical protein [Carboxylicivirga linearis]